MSDTLTKNHFANVLDEVESVPISQRPQKGFTTIAQQMQQSGNEQLRQWGGDLQQITPQLVKLCQQGG